MPEGKPKTEEERKATHEAQFGPGALPERRTGMPSEERQKLMAHLANVQSIRVNSFRPFMERKIGESSSTAANSLEIPLSQSDSHLWVITQLSAQGATASPTLIRLCIVRGDVEYLVNSDKPSAANVSVDGAGQYITGQGSKLRATFTGFTAADAIELSAHGYTIET